MIKIRMDSVRGLLRWGEMRGNIAGDTRAHRREEAMDMVSDRDDQLPQVCP